MGFVRTREVVDSETGKTRRYYQLVEDGQRVVAHLGEHSTVGDAVAELRERLRELEAKHGEHRHEADGYASRIARTYKAQLRRYHEGSIPTRNEHHGLAWPKPWATEKGRRYMRDFGHVEWKRSSLNEGRTYEAYSGYETFASWVRLHWWHEGKANELEARIDRLTAKLSKFEGLSAAGQADAGYSDERASPVEGTRNVKILQTSPAKGWKAVFAVREEGGRSRLQEERVDSFALCEDGEGNRFVSGLSEGGEVVAQRDDFVGHFSVKEPRYKIQEAVGRFVRAREQQ